MVKNKSDQNCSGIALIGIIIVIVLMGLLGGSVLMLITFSSMESLQTMNWNKAFFAAESGVSRAKTSFSTNAAYTNLPLTGMVGNASFTITVENNPENDVIVSSTGIQGDPPARWTSIWKATTGGALVMWFTNGTIIHNLADFPNNKAYGDCGQSFKMDKKTNVARIDIQGRKDSMNCSDIYMTIRSGSTVGPVLGTSEIVLSVDIPHPHADWVAFTFTTKVALEANTTYYIRLESVPPSTVRGSGAKGRFWWMYCHSAWSPPAYADGDAWRYIGRNNNPSDPGQQLGPSDQYDFNFQIYK